MNHKNFHSLLEKMVQKTVKNGHQDCTFHFRC